jgi:hypothetical protein
MTDAAIVSLLTELVVEMRGLRADIAGRQRGRLARKDHDLLAALLPIVHAAVGFRAFSVRELREHAESPVGSTLHAALTSAGGPNKVGRLLMRGAGFVIDGYVVECVGEDRDGLTWLVRAAPGHSNHNGV